MQTYIALLRGINISGKNKISMPLLKAAFEEIEFLNVITYINSGNVIFSSNVMNKNKLVKKCKSVISDKFKLDIPVTIISPQDLSDALDNAPEWWDKKKEEVNYAVFLISPVTVKEVFEAVGEAKPEYEKVGYYKDIIFWTAQRKTISKTRWYKIPSSSVNNKVTIRNANTAKKLLFLSNR